MNVDPNTINQGETVVVQDENGNVVRGPVSFDEKGRMVVEAFRTSIVFARWSNQARGGLGGYTSIKGIKIVGHQPPIDQMAFDVVPRQRFGGGNPT